MKHIIRCCEQSFGLSLVVGFVKRLGYVHHARYINNEGIWKLENEKLSQNEKFWLSKYHWFGFNDRMFQNVPEVHLKISIEIGMVASRH